MRPVFWFLAVLVAVSLLLASAHLAANTLDYSRYNVGWNGTSRFFSDLERGRAGEISTPGGLGSRHGSLLIIIAPGRPYGAEEIAAYRRYLEDGNTIFLADDTGTGNGLLRGLGSRITIREGALLSFDHEFNDPALVVVSPVRNAAIPGDPSRMLLNGPASLEGGEPLMSSSFMSWIDRNGNGRIDGGEPLGRHTVLARERIGRGEILVLADPGVFINAMYSRGDLADNRKYISFLATNTSPVLIDQVNSRTAADGGTGLALHALRRSPEAGFGILAVGVLVLAAAWRRRIL